MLWRICKTPKLSNQEVCCTVSFLPWSFKSSRYKLFLRRQTMIYCRRVLLSLLPTYKPTTYTNKEQPNQLFYLRVSFLYIASILTSQVFYFWPLPTLKLQSNFFIECLASIIKFFNNGVVTTPRFWNYFIILCITYNFMEKIGLIPGNITFPRNAML